jgi:hypothetical protein
MSRGRVTVIVNCGDMPRADPWATRRAWPSSEPRVSVVFPYCYQVSEGCHGALCGRGVLCPTMPVYAYYYRRTLRPNRLSGYKRRRLTCRNQDGVR